MFEPETILKKENYTESHSASRLDWFLRQVMVFPHVEVKSGQQMQFYSCYYKYVLVCCNWLHCSQRQTQKNTWGSCGCLLKPGETLHFLLDTADSRFSFLRRGKHRLPGELRTFYCVEALLMDDTYRSKHPQSHGSDNFSCNSFNDKLSKMWRMENLFTSFHSTRICLSTICFPGPCAVPDSRRYRL